MRNENKLKSDLLCVATRVSILKSYNWFWVKQKQNLHIFYSLPFSSLVGGFTGIV